jgi:hypothetical protein
MKRAAVIGFLPSVPTVAKLDVLKQQAVPETDKLQTFTQRMVDQIFPSWLRA